MTGFQLAERLKKRISHHIGIARGFPCRYDPRARMVYLSTAVYDGDDHMAHAIAAHEVSHAHQQARMGWGWLVLLSRIEPLNFFIEWQAWAHAMRLLIEERHPAIFTLNAYDDVRRTCLLRDFWRALRFCAVASILVGVAFWVRA